MEMVCLRCGRLVSVYWLLLVRWLAWAHRVRWRLSSNKIYSEYDARASLPVAAVDYHILR